MQACPISRVRASRGKGVLKSWESAVAASRSSETTHSGHMASTSVNKSPSLGCIVSVPGLGDEGVAGGVGCEATSGAAPASQAAFGLAFSA